MINLNKKLKMDEDKAAANNGDGDGGGSKAKFSIRDKLLVKEHQELGTILPSTCQLDFEDPDKLHEFVLTVSPDEGFWASGSFSFHVVVTEDYNIAPPIVKCQTKLWHPNINEDGAVCLSILRQSSIDEMGWAPTRHLKDIVLGLNSLFTDLLNFQDPLNTAAAEQYQKDPKAFESKVKDYIRQYAKESRKTAGRRH